MKILCQLIAFSTLALNVSAADKILGSATWPADSKIAVELSESTAAEGAGKFSLKLIADSKPLVALPLKTESLAHSKGLRQDSPLQIVNFPLAADGQAAWAIFTIDDQNGAARAVSVLLIQSEKGWIVAREWTADSAPMGEMGYKREKQIFSAPKPGTLSRNLHNLTVEGIVHKLDCGCTACQSRTIETSEDETYIWNASTATLDRTLYEKRYIVQIGEGLMSVARKALGDARLLARIYRLNPALKSETVLKEGQGILVERQPQ